MAKKKAQKQTKPDIKYYIPYHEDFYIIDEADPDDQWDNGSSGLNVTIKDVYRTEKKGYVEVYNSKHSLYGCDDIKVRKTAYIVLVKYTDGDTFGSSQYWTIPAIKKTKAQAEKIADLCEKDDPKKPYRAWDGYFSYINSVEILEFIVK